MQGTTVPVESLRAAGFGDEVEAVATAVADYLDDGVGSNVAVVSEPYAGRTALLEYAAGLLDDDVHRVRLEAVVEGKAGVPSLPDSGALLVEGCHYLFRRRIDGFAALETFLERVTLTDRLVVTAWNRYAWRYLDAVRDVADSFPVEVEIPPLSADEIAAVVTANHGPDLPAFVDDGSAGRIKTVVFDRLEVPLWRGRRVGVPYPKPNTAWVRSWWEDDADEGLRAVVFEKLRRVSHGNPGVALALWERSVRDGEIAPGYVDAPDGALDPGDDGAFLLWVVLTKEAVAVDDLAPVLGDRPVATELQSLVEAGVVSVADDRVAVEPASLHRAVGALERRGLLW